MEPQEFGESHVLTGDVYKVVNVFVTSTEKSKVMSFVGVMNVLVQFIPICSYAPGVTDKSCKIDWSFFSVSTINSP